MAAEPLHGALADLFHACFSIAELATCDSTLCIHNQWALIALVVGLFVRAVVHGWTIYRVQVFRDDLRSALAMRRINMDLFEESPAPAPAPAAASIGRAPSAKSFAARYGRK